MQISLRGSGTPDVILVIDSSTCSHQNVEAPIRSQRFAADLKIG